MKYEQGLIIFLLLFNFNLFSQKNDTINICAPINKLPAVMAFKIPDKGCNLTSENINKIINRINNQFVIDAISIFAISFSVNKYKFIELIYKSPICDTVAILFVSYGRNKLLYSNSYSVNVLENDFRFTIKNGLIIVYRKVVLGRKMVTVAFEFNKRSRRLDTFIDDGVSLW